MSKTAVKPMMGLKSIGDTSIGTATAITRIGGAAASMDVPMWADTAAVLWAHMSPTTLTADTQTIAAGYVESEDGMSIKPFEFLYSYVGAADATPSAGNSTPGEKYYWNAPVRPGSKLTFYAQALEAHTAAAYCGITVLFTNGRSSGVTAPGDPIAGIVQRYRKRGTLTATSATTAVFTPEAAYTINLGEGGGVITELGGLLGLTTATDGQPGSGRLSFESADVPMTPLQFHVNAYGSKLGATGAHDGSGCITRRPVYAEAEQVVTWVNQCATGAAVAGANGLFMTMVEFVRA